MIKIWWNCETNSAAAAVTALEHKHTFCEHYMFTVIYRSFVRVESGTERRKKQKWHMKYTIIHIERSCTRIGHRTWNNPCYTFKINSFLLCALIHRCHCCWFRAGRVYFYCYCCRCSYHCSFFKCTERNSKRDTQKTGEWTQLSACMAFTSKRCLRNSICTFLGRTKLMLLLLASGYMAYSMHMIMHSLCVCVCE